MSYRVSVSNFQVSVSAAPSQAFGGLAPQIETGNTIHLLNFCQFLQCQAPPHKSKAPCRNAKPPYWRLSGDGSGSRSRLFMAKSRSRFRSLSQVPVSTTSLRFLKNWNLFRLGCLENITKTSVYFAKISVEFRFICLSLFCSIVFSALLFLKF